MYQIFHNSFVTVAAAASESFDEGFLTRRPFEAIDIPFSSNLNPQIVGRFSLSTIPDMERLHISNDQLTADLRTCKWDTRGWVWQERKLSKRLLVLGKQMIHFKCDHCQRSENSNDLNYGNPPSADGRGSWTQWSEGYTGKHLIFLQDKFPAISGLSKLINQNSIMRRERPAQYLAVFGTALRAATHREGCNISRFGG